MSIFFRTCENKRIEQKEKYQDNDKKFHLSDNVESHQKKTKDTKSNISTTASINSNTEKNTTIVLKEFLNIFNKIKKLYLNSLIKMELNMLEIFKKLDINLTHKIGIKGKQNNNKDMIICKPIQLIGHLFTQYNLNTIEYYHIYIFTLKDFYIENLKDKEKEIKEILERISYKIKKNKNNVELYNLLVGLYNKTQNTLFYLKFMNCIINNDNKEDILENINRYIVRLNHLALKKKYTIHIILKKYIKYFQTKKYLKNNQYYGKNKKKEILDNIFTELKECWKEHYINLYPQNFYSFLLKNLKLYLKSSEKNKKILNFIKLIKTTQQDTTKIKDINKKIIKILQNESLIKKIINDFTNQINFKTPINIDNLIYQENFILAICEYLYPVHKLLTNKTERFNIKNMIKIN